MSKKLEWIGVDLDGTLAYYDGFKGFKKIGKPIEPMLARVKKWIAEGKRVKIFTARAQARKQIPWVRRWLKEVGLPDLPVTNVKDVHMSELYDDRAVQVEKNTGKVIGYSTRKNV